MTEKVYLPGEKVFVYQGPLLYDAKVLKTFDPVTQKVESFDEKKKEQVYSAPNKKFPQKFLSEVCYMVHYQGWNAKWDEWVLPSRILEVNNENLMLKENLTFEMQEQERLQREALEEEDRKKEKEKTKLTIKLQKRIPGDSRRKSSPSSSEKPEKNEDSGILSIINGNGNKKGRGKTKTGNLKHKDDESRDRCSSDIENSVKRKRLNGASSKNEANHYESKTGFTHHEIKTLVPDALKIILVDDWENITKNNKLVSLPGKCSVSKTLDDFMLYLQREFSEEVSELDIFLEMTQSIKLYFEQCLGTFLLYRYERPQYSDILDKENDSHLYDIYPSIFLLRLLSIFPNILVMNNVDPGTVRISKVYLDIILFWLDHNKGTYLVEEYENQSPWIALMQG
ncbi:hypothetical protein PICMEDRAFT_15576 [Pichia membranifaciens NRRL Y-2026]|uniref:Chromatin modification-related protein EAF3 n=1 Tax=Pichia membranifaciens NRRL Y-2026 TaxID=763406 RepID=A0A1E3NNH1_9ASCO|nr:hypothetical protein PICMEDRAFT_15576 [Pichia membranifaciens NRRL Y-2026]ODQ47651.1 hypothetical protein PICMEDRAFT_15576 [Pichia membranifaciens NRRL Y-2026]